MKSKYAREAAEIISQEGKEKMRRELGPKREDSANAARGLEGQQNEKPAVDV